jgi:MFS family permease
MTTTSHTGNLQRQVIDGSTEGPVALKGGLRKLLVWMLPTNISIFLIWGAVPGILLALQIQHIDEGDKAANLALVTGIGAFAAMLAQPIAGMVSDRTRSRFGRRAPWMVLGALVGGLALIGMGSANGLVQITLAWVMVQVALNFAQGPLSAIMPDRVPRSVRGTFAALSGLGLMLGSIGGQILGSQLATNIPAGYVILAGIAVVVVTLFVVFNPDHSSVGQPREPFSLVLFLKTFWVNPVAHPDFFWGFTGRLLLYTGYFAVSGYQLYMLQDYIGLGDGALGYVPLLGFISLAGIIVASLVSGPLSDKFGRRKIFVIIASLLLAAALAVPFASPTLGGMMIYSAISGVGFGCFQAVDTALITEVLPSKTDFGKDLGVVNIAATLPQTLAPAVAGVIVVSFGGYGTLFPVGMALVILGAIAILPIKSVR